MIQLSEDGKGLSIIVLTCLLGLASGAFISLYSNSTGEGRTPDGYTTTMTIIGFGVFYYGISKSKKRKVDLPESVISGFAAAGSFNISYLAATYFYEMSKVL